MKTLLTFLFFVQCVFAYTDTIYCNSNAVGSNDGTTWANAYTNPQSALNAGSAGELIAFLCKDTFAMVDTLRFNTIAGSSSAYVVVSSIDTINTDINYDTTGSDSMNTVFDFQNNIGFGGYFFTQSYIICKGLSFIRATLDGINTEVSGGGDYLIFDRCSFKACGDEGAETGGNSRRVTFQHCLSSGNTGRGFESAGDALYFACVSTGNTSHGFNFAGTSIVATNCISHDNADGTYNFNIANHSILLINCIADGTDQASETGIFLGGAAANAQLKDCRITNCATGLNAGSLTCLVENTVFYNTDDTSSVAGTLFNKCVFDSEDGYTNKATNDFSISTGKTNRRFLKYRMIF